MIAVIGLSVLHIPGGAILQAQQSPRHSRDPVEQVLVPRVTPSFQSPVLVLGTPHLAGERSRLTQGHLEPLLARLGSANEIVTVAMPLARRLGLQLLHAIDSQYDGVRTLGLSADARAAIFDDPARPALMDSAWVRRTAGIRDAAFAAG